MLLLLVYTPTVCPVAAVNRNEIRINSVKTVHNHLNYFDFMFVQEEV